jgi:tetratricopeptide (TPR) repeat protein/predicted Ser/Thr protein kinase
MIGSRVSHYRITGRLGEGGMGVVYEAVDEVLGRSVALKFPSREATSSHQLADEARAASRLNHPNVAQIYEFSDSIEGAFIAMELVRGRTLRDLLEAGRLDPTEAVRIVLAVAEALDEAHRQDLIHLDIKPGNIAISERGVVKVLDFGLAKALPPARIDLGDLAGDPRTETMNVLCRGTPCYMSPEQARGEKLDARSDLFSLGAVLYECLTGRRAFPGQSAVSALMEVVSADPPAPSTIVRTVPPRLDAIVRRLLEKDRAARYASAADLAADLRAVERKPAGRRWHRAMPPAVVALALLIAGAVTLRTLSKPAPIRQVVVLPFQNEGPQNQAVFGDGVTEVVTGMVANLSDSVWAVPAVDVRRYGVQTPADAGRTFHADLAISGTVRREAGAGVWNVTLSLSNTSPGRTLNQRIVRLEDSRPADAEPALREALSALLQVKARHAPAASQTQLSSYSRFVAARGLLRQFDRGDNLKNAVAELQKITDAEPGYAPAQVALGEACFRMFSATRETEWLARADQAVRRAAEIDENEPGIHLMLGRILRATGQTDAAIGELKTALTRDPRDVQALLQLAGAYEAAKRPVDAEETYRQIIRLRPSYFPAYTNLGILYMSQGKWQQAEEPLTLVTKLAPDYADGYSALGSLEYYLDHLDRAKALFTRSIELKVTGPAYANRCAVEFDISDMAAASADCRKAVELQPANPISWGNLADVLVQRGQAAEATTTYNKAIELGNKQLAINPANPDLLGVMSKFAAKTGQKQLALDLAGKALAQSSAVRVLYNAGKSYGLAGDCARSTQLLKQAFDQGYPRPEAKKDPDLNRLRAAPLSCAVPPI